MRRSQPIAKAAYLGLKQVAKYGYWAAYLEVALDPGVQSQIMHQCGIEGWQLETEGCQ